MKRPKSRRFKKYKDFLKQWLINLKTGKIQKRKQQRKSIEELEKEMKKTDFLTWAKHKLGGVK